MIKITKLSEPVSLTQYKNQADAIYDGPNFTKVKDDIRARLLQEQGHVCAYCMRRIKVENMKVEHFKCQHAHGYLQLDYVNMLGCCNGNEGQSFKNQTCDTKKGSQELRYSPAINGPYIESKINYLSNGRICSSDPDLNSDINVVLNLNSSRLVSNRYNAQKGIENILSKRNGTRSKKEIESLINKYSNININGCYHEYYGIILNYLQRKLKRAQN